MKRPTALTMPIRYFVLFYFLSVVAWAQNINFVVTPSPHAARVVNSVDIPAAIHTGVPDISIPLFVVRGKKLGQPISLSYQASGIKVADRGGATGLGWSLGGGGMVTRVMRGRPDDKSNGFFQYAANIPNEQDNISISTKTQLAENQMDMLSDFFYYGTGTDGGKFIFDNQKVPRLIPRKDVKIWTNMALDTFKVTDPDGTKYIFTGGEQTSFGSLPQYQSSWNLSKIISVDNTDTIRFNYASLPDYDYHLTQNGVAYFFYQVPANAFVLDASLHYDTVQSEVSVTGAKYLQSIESSTQKLEFQFVTIGVLPRRLDKVILYRKSPINGSLVLERTVHFWYQLFQDTDNGWRRLRLDSIKESAPDGTFQPPYKFTYSSKKLPRPNSKAQDHWGYYNGATANTSLIPALTVYGHTVSTNDREVHSTYVDGCMLTKIISPLGASTEYFFQGNSPGSGMRVSKIIQDDPYSDIHVTTNYDYNDPSTGSSSGKLLENPGYTYTMNVRDNTPGTTLDYYCQMIALHATGSGTFANLPVVYQYVTTYSNDDVNATGKTINKFSVLSGVTMSFPFFPSSDNSWLVGNLAQSEDYKVVSGTSTIVDKTINTYKTSPNFNTITGLRVAVANILFGTVTPTNNDFVVDNSIEYSKFHFLGKSEDYTYEQNSGTINLSRTKRISFDNTSVHLQPTKVVTSTSQGTDSLQIEFTYPFDYAASGVMGVMQNLHMKSYPVETRSILKEGSTEYVIDHQKTDYYQWTTSGVYPQYGHRGKFSGKVPKSTFLSNPSSYLQIVQNFLSYDANGFLNASQREGGIPSSEIFDPRLGGVKTAEVLNAQANQIAYAGFESKSNGGWIIINPTLIDTDSKMGTYCLQLVSGVPLYKTMLPAGNYSVTYFEKGGTATFSLSGGATLTGSQSVSAGADGWTLRIKHVNITGTGNVIEISGSNIKIDEVRLHPKDAIMSTTSYNAFALPTTVTDGQMNCRYFEYDSWNRVKVIRDSKRNILEYYEYKVADN